MNSNFIPPEKSDPLFGTPTLRVEPRATNSIQSPISNEKSIHRTDDGHGDATRPALPAFNPRLPLHPVPPDTPHGEDNIRALEKRRATRRRRPTPSASRGGRCVALAQPMAAQYWVPYAAKTSASSNSRSVISGCGTVRTHPGRTMTRRLGWNSTVEEGACRRRYAGHPHALEQMHGTLPRGGDETAALASERHVGWRRRRLW